MTMRKIVYSNIALSKRKAIKKYVKQKYGADVADKVSKSISKAIAHLKCFPDTGISMRNKYDLDCDYYMLFVEHNYFIYRIQDDIILILEVFHEKEDFMCQMFGVITTSRETLNYWGAD